MAATKTKRKKKNPARRPRPRTKAKKSTSKKRTANPTPRRAKMNRWYKGPKGTKLRFRRSRGQIVVDVKK